MVPELVAAACSLGASQIPLQSQINHWKLSPKGQSEKNNKGIIWLQFTTFRYICTLSDRKESRPALVFPAENNRQAIILLESGAVIGHKIRVFISFDSVFICPCSLCSSQMAQNGNSSAHW